ncbi:MAG: carbohydrate ABC transporter permease [Eubacteriales bacterium]|nr:carbohydrate ABC transporter permease [Clostridiales bacterium]
MALARKRRIADSTEDRVFYILNAVILTLLLFVTLYPLYFVIIASVSDYRAVGTGQVLFWPKGFSLFAYQKVFQKQSVLIGYRNTIFYTIVGTAINLGLTLLTGYALSVKFPGRRIANFFIVFTMYFSGGIIPTYFVIRDLHLLNTIWVMLLPGAISAYNLILTRSFIQSSIPQELYEAASIDGCTRIQYFLKIVLPLSGVLVSVMTLFYAVGHWNSYFNAMMYIDDVNLFPLQLVLREILINNNISTDDMIDPEAIERAEMLRELLKYALIVVSSVPLLILYPFLQKYFVKGIMIGSIKG